MRLYTPDSLLYPITVAKLLCKPGDEIAVKLNEYMDTVDGGKSCAYRWPPKAAEFR